MPKHHKTAKKPQKALDAFSEKRGRGRPWKIRASEVSGRAYNYRLIFSQTWDVLGKELLRARTEEDVTQALEKDGRYISDFRPIAPLILKVLREREFPKRREAQINFLADSLAARGVVSPRRSRDICAKELAKERAKSPHKILRREFYIECSCGYKGPARDNACRTCGALIQPSLEELLAPRIF